MLVIEDAVRCKVNDPIPGQLRARCKLAIGFKTGSRQACSYWCESGDRRRLLPGEQEARDLPATVNDTTVAKGPTRFIRPCRLAACIVPCSRRAWHTWIFRRENGVCQHGEFVDCPRPTDF